MIVSAPSLKDHLALSFTALAPRGGLPRYHGRLSEESLRLILDV